MRKVHRVVRDSIIAALLIGSGCDRSPEAHVESASPTASAAGPSPAIAPPGKQETAPASMPDVTGELGELPGEAFQREYAALLAEVVTEDGLVRYDLLTARKRINRILALVDSVATMPLPEVERERLAFWCNAYNVNVLTNALRESMKPGFKTVKDVPGFFDKTTITVAGEDLTLNELENERIRPMGDARIHAALVCAALGCPPLRAEPFDATRLDEQLDEQCHIWVNDVSKFQVDGGKLAMSEILKWYGGDFKGAPYGNAVGFVLAHADPNGDIVKLIMARDGTPETTWIPYDWTLNQARKKRSSAS